MFSRYKKAEGATPARKVVKTAPVAEATKAAAPAAPAPQPEAQPQVLRKPIQRQAAKAASSDRDRKRKERMQEIKVELHRALLDNLNLAALEHATETELRSEISQIASEILEEKSIVLNREDRTTLNKELYDEVTGLGPLETLLQD